MSSVSGSHNIRALSAFLQSDWQLSPIGLVPDVVRYLLQPLVLPPPAPPLEPFRNLFKPIMCGTCGKKCGSLYGFGSEVIYINFRCQDKCLKMAETVFHADNLHWFCPQCITDRCRVGKTAFPTVCFWCEAERASQECGYCVGGFAHKRAVLACQRCHKGKLTCVWCASRLDYSPVQICHTCNLRHRMFP